MIQLFSKFSIEVKHKLEKCVLCGDCVMNRMKWCIYNKWINK